MARKLGERDSAAEMRKAFQLFDDDGSGRVCMYAVCLLVAVVDVIGRGSMGVRGPIRRPHMHPSVPDQLVPTTITRQITVAKLRRIARELGEALTEEELRDMVEEADRSGSGDGVSFEDFSALMRKTNLF